MTQRIFGFHVLLDKEIRIDDAQVIIDAVKQIRHVKDVRVHISTAENYFAYQTAKMEYYEKLKEAMLAVLKD